MEIVLWLRFSMFDTQYKIYKLYYVHSFFTSVLKQALLRVECNFSSLCLAAVYVEKFLRSVHRKMRMTYGSNFWIFFHSLVIHGIRYNILPNSASTDLLRRPKPLKNIINNPRCTIIHSYVVFLLIALGSSPFDFSVFSFDDVAAKWAKPRVVYDPYSW